MVYVWSLPQSQLCLRFDILPTFVFESELDDGDFFSSDAGESLQLMDLKLLPAVFFWLFAFDAATGAFPDQSSRLNTPPVDFLALGADVDAFLDFGPSDQSLPFNCVEGFFGVTRFFNFIHPSWS